jgi:hypothetical protein
VPWPPRYFRLAQHTPEKATTRVVLCAFSGDPRPP